MKHGPLEDVFPIENGDIPLLIMLVYWRVNTKKMSFEKQHFNAVGFLSLLLLTDLQRLHGTIWKVHKALSVFFSW